MVLFHPLPSHVMSRAHHKGVGIGAGSTEPSLPWVQPITPRYECTEFVDNSVVIGGATEAGKII